MDELMNYNYLAASTPNCDEYERGLKERKKRHLESIRGRNERPWQPCLHDGCSECVGTGIKRDGSACVHSLSCSCPRCSPFTL